MLWRAAVSFSLLLGIARSSPWPHPPFISDVSLLATPLSFVGTPASAIAVSNPGSRKHRSPHFRSQIRRSTIQTSDRRSSGCSGCPQSIGNPLRRRSRHPAHTRSSSSSSLSMGRRTELGASPWKTDTRTVQEWLEFSERELRKISKVLGPPRTGRDLDERLGLLADGKTDSVVGFLRVDFRMSKADTRSMMIRFPRLLVMPREEAVDRCDWLVANLSLNKKQMARMVLKCPILFAYGPEVSYAPAVEWFREYLRMDTREVARLAVRLPQVLGLSPDGNLKKTVRFFESLGLSRGQVCRMVLLHPQLFSYSIEGKMIPMLEWLQMQLRASPDEVIEMVTKYPSLMGCSMTRNLAPKLSFLREVMKASIPDVRAAVVACPSLLGYSLERRIRPRVTLMLERGVDPMFGDHKWLVTVVPDDKFEEWIQENTGLKR